MSIKTQAQITAEISVNISDALNKQNTAALVRQVCNDLNDTMFSLQTSLTIANDTTTNANVFPIWASANSGNLPLKVTSTKFSLNPSTGNLTLTGNATINTLTVGLGLGSLSTNSVLGVSGLNSNTTGTENTAIGYHALKLNTTGFSNTAIGSNVLSVNTTTSNNVGIGDSALIINIGNNNTGIGVTSLFSNTTGSSNMALGFEALRSNTTGSSNVGIGNDAGYSNTTGSFNIYIGDNTVGNPGITTGSYNTIIGTVTGLSASLSNNIILADGQGNKRLQFNNTGVLTLTGPAVTASIATASTNKVAITINGVQYYLLVTT